MRDELIEVLSLIVMCLLLVLALKIMVVILRNEAIARRILDFLRQIFRQPFVLILYINPRSLSY